MASCNLVFQSFWTASKNIQIEALNLKFVQINSNFCSILLQAVKKETFLIQIFNRIWNSTLERYFSKLERLFPNCGNAKLGRFVIQDWSFIFQEKKLQTIQYILNSYQIRLTYEITIINVPLPSSNIKNRVQKLNLLWHTPCFAGTKCIQKHKLTPCLNKARLQQVYPGWTCNRNCATGHLKSTCS